MDTKTSESAQALFCALADYVQLKRGDLDKVFDIETLRTYKEFKSNWDGTYPSYKISDIFKKNIETDVTTLAPIERELIANPDWYKSSLIIAKKLIEDIDTVVRGFKGIKKPKPTEIWFTRGDDAIAGNIQKLFEVANKTRKEMNKVDGIKKKGVEFGQLNKWNPSDIYFATNVARDALEKEVKKISAKDGNCYLFSQLNSLISNLIEDGQLLPLSLKKSTISVNLYKVNFDRKYELSQFKDLKYDGLVKPFQKSTEGNLKTRDITVKFNPKDNKFKFQVQHDVTNAGFKVSISGVEARGGGISSIDVFTSLMRPIDDKAAKSFKKTFEDGNKKYRDWKKNWVKQFGPAPQGNEAKLQASPLRKKFEIDRSTASAINVTNKILPELEKWLEQSQEKSDKFVKIIYEYATSRTEDSGKFVIAKSL
jgi:hypothetical protein